MKDRIYKLKRKEISLSLALKATAVFYKFLHLRVTITDQ
jgi:hypothetical protein